MHKLSSICDASALQACKRPRRKIPIITRRHVHPSQACTCVHTVAGNQNPQSPATKLLPPQCFCMLYSLPLTSRHDEAYHYRELMVESCSRRTARVMCCHGMLYLGRVCPQFHNYLMHVMSPITQAGSIAHALTSRPVGSMRQGHDADVMYL